MIFAWLQVEVKLLKATPGERWPNLGVGLPGNDMHGDSVTELRQKLLTFPEFRKWKLASKSRLTHDTMRKSINFCKSIFNIFWFSSKAAVRQTFLVIFPKSKPIRFGKTLWFFFLKLPGFILEFPDFSEKIRFWGIFSRNSITTEHFRKKLASFDNSWDFETNPTDFWRKKLPLVCSGPPHVLVSKF